MIYFILLSWWILHHIYVYWSASPPKNHIPRGVLRAGGEAYRLYCFNTGTWPVEVYFVDDPTKKHLPSLLPELAVHTSFFVPLSFGSGDAGSGNATFQHLCIDDLYSGHLNALTPQHFEWNWSVQGPNKDGTFRDGWCR
ncbi:unnamed protein product [Cladocopium goreaui]|uniref:DUF6314 domain-containing protein n=1 Tax=Cladocopium goreaui TaxID=2562237 RepID=A0A9P1FJI0_9DINO|nr:unnamed protein product [Cladocopium goreaui]